MQEAVCNVVEAAVARSWQTSLAKSEIRSLTNAFDADLAESESECSFMKMCSVGHIPKSTKQRMRRASRLGMHFVLELWWQASQFWSGLTCDAPIMGFDVQVEKSLGRKVLTPIRPVVSRSTR